MGKRIGIDLGTTYSCISYVDEDGNVKIIDNAEGEQTTPSVVYFSGDEVIVGSTARQEGGMNPENIVERVKNHMGLPGYTINVEGNEYSPAAVSKLILEKLIRDAKDYLGDEIDGVVITCPAYFGDHARGATKLAGENAGVKVLQILDEPVAAAVAYAYSRKEDMEKNILIYDLGGGTFDCTVVKLTLKGDSRDVKIITTGGDHLLGGKDWDDALTKYMRDEFCNRTGADPSSMEADPDCIAMFSEYSEKTKKLLTTKESAAMTISFDGQKEKVEITREQFEAATEGLLSQSITLIDNMMTAKGLSIEKDIDEIILVGGSTRMPQVKKRLEQEYGKPISSYEPDKAVAMGAALISVTATGEPENPGDPAPAPVENIPGGLSGMVVTPICTKSYGLITYMGDKRMVSNIIIKDTEKPAEKSRTFSARSDNQASVMLEIFENDSLEEDVEEDLSTKMYEDEPVPFPYAVKAGTPVGVTFKVTVDGTLEVGISVNNEPPVFVTPKRLGNDTNNIGMERTIG